MAMQVRQTKQKAKIYDALCVLNHPTATEVYTWLQETDETISRATVFRVLAGFVDAGKALELRLSGAETRYDFNTHAHYHAHCSHCGRVTDVSMPVLKEFACVETTDGAFEVQGYSVEFFGKCGECKRKETTS